MLTSHTMGPHMELLDLHMGLWEKFTIYLFHLFSFTNEYYKCCSMKKQATFQLRVNFSLCYYPDMLH